MDLKAILGDQYKEGMTFDEVSAILEGITMHTDQDVKANFVSKKLFDKTASDLAAAKRTAKTAVGEAQSEQDKLLERISALETTLKESAREAKIAEDSAALVAQGYSAELAKATATAMADGDTATILKNQGVFLAEKTQSIKEELLKGTKPPAAGGAANGGGIDYEKSKKDALEHGDDFAFAQAVAQQFFDKSNTDAQ